MNSADQVADIKRKSVRGGMVTLSGQAISLLANVASTLILSRLLSPTDFGVISMVLAFTAFANLFRDLGISAASIQRAGLTHGQMTNLFWLNVMAGLVLSLIVVAASPLVAWFYGRPELRAVTAVLSLTFLASSIGAQHSALLQREMRFSSKVTADVLGVVTTLIVSCVLALAGFGYWALAIGTIAGAMVTSAIYVVTSGFRPGLPRRDAEIRSIVGFGAHVTGFEIVNYFHRNFDNILIGRVWGADALGLYSRAYQLLMLPIANLRTPINAVAYPALSRLRADAVSYRRFFVKIASLLAFLSMPLTTYMAVNSDIVIRLALGEQWMGAAPIFQALALSAFIQPVASLRGLVLLSSGYSRRYFYWGIVNAACVVVGFAIGVRWGAIGVAYAYAIVNYTLLYFSLALLFRGTPVRVSDFFRSVAMPACTSLAAGAISYGSVALLSDTTATALKVLVSALAFTASFFAIYAGIPEGRRELRSFRSIIADARRKNDSNPSEAPN
ncbi:lipopolysaccharide biosynthesis protein [Solimonas marina]|uniref:Lipopolysaccharide biosynthesis protein n=1 Tax=Solimonas marina TaxID=2714601 RepID=A0A969W783_9GAMM|nr:lipopolysaccharide biosynthesis protein [Solimonas marina]NKF21887.1 lipopolysaccharide biosynthesis protein [Solimonas marina]